MEKVFRSPKSILLRDDTAPTIQIASFIFHAFLRTPPRNNENRNSTIRDPCCSDESLARLCPSVPRGKDRELTEVAKEVLTTSPNDCNFRHHAHDSISLTLFSTSCWCRRPFSCLPVTVFWPSFFQGVPNATFTGSYKFSAWSSSFPAWCSCVEWNLCISSPFTGFWASLPPFWPSSCPWPVTPFS